MKVFQNIFNNRLNKIIQANSSRNRALFQCILELGFPVEKARKTILDLNDVNIMKGGHPLKAPVKRKYSSIAN